mgnify:CR=1 FL=1
MKGRKGLFIVSGVLALSALLAESLLYAVPAHAAGQVRFTRPTWWNAHYDGIAAAEYAKRWVKEPNPEYADYRYDGGDCTNFVSQALRAGGMEDRNDDGYWLSDSAWFYNGPSPGQRSGSWTHAEYFRRHWGESNYYGTARGAKRAYEMVVYTKQEALDNFREIYKSLWEGDVVQYVGREDGGELTTIHTNIVVSWNPANGGTVTMAQHSDYAGTWDLVDLRTYIANRAGLEYVVLLKMKYRTS